MRQDRVWARAQGRWDMARVVEGDGERWIFWESSAGKLQGWHQPCPPARAPCADRGDG